MTTLSDITPKDSETVRLIYEQYKKSGDAESSRGYLGASIIGHPCERYLWYYFRGCCVSNIDGRTYRLFETGDLAEARFCENLRSIGCEVHDLDASGEQFAVSALGGHFSGHMDAAILGVPEAPKTWHNGEFKTHNSKSFAKLKKKGVEKAKPQHYAQMQIYMHLAGMTRALYLAVNKDTDELHSERIRYDKLFCECLMERAERVITWTEPPERISKRADWYECSWCGAKEICWGEAGRTPSGVGYWAGYLPALPVVHISCRQCCHATPKMDGCARWECEKHKRSLSYEDQKKACDDHLVLPGLIGFAQPLDYDDGCIVFNGEGGQWKHGRGGYSTKELMVMSPSDLTNPMIGKAKDLFGAEVISESLPDDIISRYPLEECRQVFNGPVGLCKEKWWQVYKEDLDKLAPIKAHEGFNFRAAEYENGRCVILWTEMKSIGSSNCEIREGIV